jgi:hypothetical protein
MKSKVGSEELTGEIDDTKQAEVSQEQALKALSR